MKIKSHETITTIHCQETSFTYMETCPKCNNPGKDYLTACKEVFG